MSLNSLNSLAKPHLSVASPSKTRGILPEGSKVCPVLPKELWQIIFDLGSRGGESLKHLASYGRVCHLFLEICLEQYRLPHILSHAKAADFPNPRVFSQNFLLKEKVLLAVDEKQRYYYGANIRDESLPMMMRRDGKEIYDSLQRERYDLFIFMPVDNPDGFALERIPLRSSEQSVSHLKPISCHTIQEGFVVVTLADIKIWKYSPGGRPECKHTLRPPPRYCITSSAYHDDKIYFKCDSSSYDCTSRFYRVDLSQEKPSPSLIILNTDYDIRHGELCNLGKELFFAADVQTGADAWKKQKKYYAVVEKMVDGSYILEKRSELFTINLYPNDGVSKVNNWICGTYDAGSKDFLHAFNLENLLNNLDEDRNLSPHIQHEEEIAWPITYTHCVLEDFLFFSKNNGLVVYHLPTKKDCTEQWRPFLSHYLPHAFFGASSEKEKGTERTLLHINVRMSAEDTYFLDLLLSSSKKAGVGILESVSIPLKMPFVPSTEIVRTIFTEPQTAAKVSEPVCSTSPPPISHPEPVVLKSTRKQTDGKIIIVVGVVLLLMTAFLSAALMVWKPGIVIYQGSGIILTLPAVMALSIGGISSLLTIAVGSYLWWKNHKAQV